MNKTNIDRDELVAALVADYRRELAELTDGELLDHFQIQKGIQAMTPDDWAKVAGQ